MSHRRQFNLWIFGITFIGVLITVRLAYASILGNPSFEDPIGGDTNINWDSTNGADRVNNAQLAAANPLFSAIPNGTAALLLNAASEFTFQQTRNIKPGDFVSFRVNVETDIVADGGATTGGRIHIEFRKYTDTAKSQTALISQTDSGNITDALFGAGSGFPQFPTAAALTAIAPSGTELVVFVMERRTAAGGGTNIVFDNVNAEVNPAKLVLSASKTTVKQGDLVTVVADFRNDSAGNLTNAQMKVEVPPGLDLLSDSIEVDGIKGLALEGSVIIPIRTIRPNNSAHIVFQVLVTSGVSLGKSYELIVSVITGNRVSETSSLIFRIRGDPLFDEGTVLGKVFDDRDEDGVQSKGEIGVPRVRLYTEYGVGVITDQDGRFHIPAVQPGRHVLKIDGHTLPKGTSFVTEESLLIKTTPGLLNKVRFAVHLPDSALPEEFLRNLHLWVTQGIDLTRPQLAVTLDPDLLKVGLGRFEREPVFKIKTNYGEYIASWRLAIQDEMGHKIWTGFGIGPPPIQVPWNGMIDSGEMIPSGVYAYRLAVRDSQDREDWTSLQFFQVVSKAEGYRDDEKPFEVPNVGNFNIFRDGKRSIPLVAKPTVRIYGKTEPNRRVQVMGVPVAVGPTGEFEQELFVLPGEKKIQVTSTNPEGDAVNIEEEITVKDSTFFLVALGEEEVGLNFIKGNLDTVARDDTFHEDFYENGRLSYYLKAKIKGKFLVKSHYDTSDKRSELFTQLDPDDYYPVYGDYSQIDYEGQDTRQRFFILVEMDRSFLKWGSYETNFSETELGRYNRTLSGLKVHYETLSSTKYGDAKRGFTLFGSKASYLADHNEFAATGGSLYYLHNRNVIQGSEKIRIEIRDKITGIPVENRDLVYGKDYEIDYRQGRILLREPLSSVSASDTIITNDILDGNPVFLIVDYEFENFRIFEEGAAGIRGYTHFGDHVRIGGTAVEEKRANQDYDLRAVDATVRAGRNTKVTLEYAETQNQQVRQGLSYDGGLSFNNQGLVAALRPREKAYLIKGESKPVDRLELSGYLQDVEPGFSTDNSRSQEGFRKYGLEARLRINQHLHLIGRHDSTELSAQIRPLTLYGVSATLEKIRSTTGQVVFDYGQWNVIGEYLHQQLDIPLQNRIDSLFSENPFGNAVALKVAHQVTDWLTPYVKGQLTFAGKQNYQIGGGAEVKVGQKTKIYFEEMIGGIGDSTILGINVQQDEKTSSYATIKIRDFGFGDKKISTTIGSNHQLSENSRVYSEREYSTYSGNLPNGLVPTLFDGGGAPGIWSSDVYGYETHFWDRWNFGARFERRHLAASDFRNLSDIAISDLTRANTFNTLAISMGYNDHKRFKWEDSVETRIDPTAPEVQQWVIQNLIEWKLNQDLSFLGRTNFGNSRFVEPGDLTGRFVELNAGLAYRPVETDRFNWLTRYTFLDEIAADSQFISSDSGTVATNERAHILSFEGAYELTRHLQTVDKVAYRLGSFAPTGHDPLSVGTILLLHRFNYHITRKWDLGLEYRALFQSEAADSFRHGPLIEIDRELYDYVRLGIGYNFTDFEDDLRKVNDFRRNNLFVRLSGKV